MVRIAAMMTSVTSFCVNTSTVRMISTSWMVVMSAPTLKRHWNRSQT